VIARGLSPFARVPERLSIAPAGAATATKRRRAYFGPDHGWREVPVVGRSGLGAGAHRGPLILEHYDTTIVVPPDCRLEIDQRDNVVIQVGGARDRPEAPAPVAARS